MKKPLICFLAAVTSVYIGSAGINVSAIMEPGDVTFCVYRSDDSEVVIVPEKTDDGKVINEVYLEDNPVIKKVVLTDTVDEVEVPEGYAKDTITGEGTNGNPYIITNTKEEHPEIEKYINTNVHEFVDIEEVFTYDIIAYVTKQLETFQRLLVQS